MTKVLLVEDDNNLREIYEARLAAEGYEISTAKDGEDALAVAKQVKPDLIISDVMMPRISGFEMLDILRNTEGLKHTKIIMLTALGQAEDKTRADSLGADRYLVKSQVTLEDIVKAADELLNPDAAVAAPAEASAVTAEPTPVAQAAPTFSPIASPDVAAAAHQPEANQAVPTMPTVSASEPNDNPEAAVTPIPDVPVQPAPVAEPQQAAPTPVPAPEPATDAVQPAPTPVSDDSTPQEDEPLIQMPPQPVGTEAAITTTGQAQSTSQENAAVAQQIENFVNTEPATPPPAVQPEPAPIAPSADSTPIDTANDDVIKAAIDTLAATDQPAPIAAEPTSAEATNPSNQPDAEPSVAQIPGKKVITPLNDPTASGNELQTLLAQEQMKEDLEKGVTGTPVVVDTTAAETPPVAEPAPTPAPQSSTPPPDSVFTPNQNGNANENAL